MLTSIRQRQTDALKQLVNLNQSLNNTFANEPQWKVLIFDDAGQNILSPLLSVKELRDLGVTLYLQLTGHRECLPDVPAVYFVAPTEENVAKICQDLNSGLYEQYYFNFISPIYRPQLETLAAAAVHNVCVDQVQKVYDQYLNFISLEDDFFILRKHDRNGPLSYYAINCGSLSQEDVEKMTDQVVEGLFAVCVTLGNVPIIRCPKGNAAEQVAEKLDRKLRDNLRDARNNLFTAEALRAGQVSFQRPVLIILDRSMDMATPLHHTWTYQALVHDVLDLALNRVAIKEKGSTQESSTQTRIKDYDLNSTDKFWSAQKGNPFPAVAEAVQEELEYINRSKDDIGRLKHQMGLDAQNDQMVSMITDTTSKLTSTVSSLPELLERKRTIDMHMNVATAVLQEVKARKLDAYFEAEEKLMNRQTPERPLLDMLKDGECGAVEDKLRLLLIYYMLNDVTPAELQTLTAAAEAAGCTDLSALKYVKQWKTFAKMFSRDQYAGGGTKTLTMFSKLLTQSSQLVMEGVKNLAIKKHNLPVTRVVDAIMEMKTLPEIEDYRYFDPKLLRNTDSASVPRNKSPFHEALVFMVGGGNYVEYQNLVDYRKSKTTPVAKRITYGCTDLVNAREFLSQLSRLGGEV